MHKNTNVFHIQKLHSPNYLGYSLLTLKENGNNIKFYPPEWSKQNFECPSIDLYYSEIKK